VARLAFLLPNFAVGGAQRVALKLIRDFAEQGHSVDLVLLRGDGDLVQMLPGEVRIIDLKAARIRDALLPLIRYLRHETPDGVQASMWPLTCIAVVAHRISGSRARLVVSEHTTLSRGYAHFDKVRRALMRLSLKWLYPLADARVAVSNGAGDDLARLGWLKRSRVTIVYNPIDIPTRIKSSPQVEALWGDSGYRILTVGRLKPAKNYPLLLNAFARISDLNARLMILGEGPLRKQLERQVRELGIAERVIMPGSFPDPWPFYASADLFVLSSDYEGFGNVLIEAMAAGVPVVSTDCPHGPAEILDGGRFGRLVPSGNAEALADAIAESVAAPANAEALKRRATELSGAAYQAYASLLITPRIGSD
jgi:glycosyltransferase involved in cell wall biosynthesis